MHKVLALLQTRVVTIAFRLFRRHAVYERVSVPSILLVDSIVIRDTTTEYCLESDTQAVTKF